MGWVVWPGHHTGHVAVAGRWAAGVPLIPQTYACLALGCLFKSGAHGDAGDPEDGGGVIVHLPSGRGAGLGQHRYSDCQNVRWGCKRLLGCGSCRPSTSLS